MKKIGLMFMIFSIFCAFENIASGKKATLQQKILEDLVIKIKNLIQGEIEKFKLSMKKSYESEILNHEDFFPVFYSGTPKEGELKKFVENFTKSTSDYVRELKRKIKSSASRSEIANELVSHLITTQTKEVKVYDKASKKVLRYATPNTVTIREENDLELYKDECVLLSVTHLLILTGLILDRLFSEGERVSAAILDYLKKVSPSQKLKPMVPSLSDRKKGKSKTGKPVAKENEVDKLLRLLQGLSS